MLAATVAVATTLPITAAGGVVLVAAGEALLVVVLVFELLEALAGVEAAREEGACDGAPVAAAVVVGVVVVVVVVVVIDAVAVATLGEGVAETVPADKVRAPLTVAPAVVVAGNAIATLRGSFGASARESDGKDACCGVGVGVGAVAADEACGVCSAGKEVAAALDVVVLTFAPADADCDEAALLE